MNYYVNKNAQETKEHEVHKSDCSYLPDIENRIFLGNYPNCKYAIKKAKVYFEDIDGCAHCCPDCHAK